MDWERRRKLMFRWSLVVSGFFLFFWTIWYLDNGSVPEINSIKVMEYWTYILPFSISRWWDVLFAPIFAASLVLIFTSEKIRNNEDLVGSFLFSFSFSFLLSFSNFFGFGLVFSLVACFVAGFATDIIVGTGIGSVAGTGISLGNSFGIGFEISLVFSFGVGLGRLVGLSSGFSEK